MAKWFIEVDGKKHDFHNWKECLRAWDAVKAEAPGTAFLARRQGDSNITLDCA